MRPSRQRLGALLLFLVIVGTSAVSLGANAGLDGPVPGGYVPAPKGGGEVAETVARAAALYRQFKSGEALAELKKALALAPDDPEILIWIARTYIDVGDLIPETTPGWQAKRIERYRAAERYARAAVTASPESTWPHFFLAVALSKLADFCGTKKQIVLAKEIRKEVDRAIALDPDNGFAYHVLGVWHRRMAEINQAERLLARVLLLKSVPAGHLDDSVHFLEKAIRHNPDVITHHLELARTYHALGKPDLAKEHLGAVNRLPVKFSDDGLHKLNARKLLKQIERNGGGCHEPC